MGRILACKQPRSGSRARLRLLRFFEFTNVAAASRRVFTPPAAQAPNLIFLVVSLVAPRTHRMSRYVIRHSSAQRIRTQARRPEVNAAKHARIDDFRYRLREARKRSSTRTYLRRDAKRCVLSKHGGKE